MPRLTERAAGTLGHLAPKAADLLSVTGFAAAGVVSVVAENLRTLADREEALPDRAKQVAQNSIGAVLAGPTALSQRGRQLVGRGEDGDGSNGHAGRDRERPRPESAKTTAKTVAPAERPDRSKAEEARDRGADADGTTAAGPRTAPRAIDPSSAEAATGTAKPASRDQDRQAGATKDEADARKQQAKDAAAKAGTTTAKEPAAKEPAAKESTAKTSGGAKKAAAKKPAAKKAAAKKPAAEEGPAAPQAPARTRSVEEQRAAEKTARKQEAAEAEADDTPARPDGLPDDVDEQLVADLQRMTVKQLRDRAAADGVPGRSGMSKDELVVALATRETDDVPAKG